MTTPSARSHYIVRDTVRLHYLEWGTPGRHPIVLVHGGRLHARVWNDFSRRFGDRYHIVAVDQRGHGESGWGVADDYHLEEFYGDLRAVIEARRLSGFTLVGHSLGGMVSMLYAHRHAGEVERLVLVDITPGRPPRPARPDDSAAPPARQTHEFDSLESAAAYLAAAMPRAPRHLVEESVQHGLRRTDEGRYTWKYDPALFRRRGTAAARVDLWSVAAQIPTPTLLQVGTLSDVVTPELAARLASVMPRCTVEHIEGAGHGLFTDCPDAFADSVERFLAEPPDPAPPKQA